MNDKALIKLITDEDAPTAAALGTAGGSMARVKDLVAFVADRLGEPCSETEAELDRVLLANGGAKGAATDLNELLPNLWRRIRGKPRVGGPAMYEIPRSLYEESGAQQTNVQLPGRESN
jgi:hypothetical protein